MRWQWKKTINEKGRDLLFTINSNYLICNLVRINFRDKDPNQNLKTFPKFSHKTLKKVSIIIVSWNDGSKSIHNMKVMQNYAFIKPGTCFFLSIFYLFIFLLSLTLSKFDDLVFFFFFFGLFYLTFLLILIYCLHALKFCLEDFCFLGSVSLMKVSLVFS